MSPSKSECVLVCPGVTECVSVFKCARVCPDVCDVIRLCPNISEVVVQTLEAIYLTVCLFVYLTNGQTGHISYGKFIL